MSTETVTVQLPAPLYADLQSLAAEEQVEPLSLIARLIQTARQRRAWIRGWDELGELVRQDGSTPVVLTKDEIAEQTRQTRREIFEAEYAHLYR